MTPGNGTVPLLTPAEAEQRRLQALSAQSEADDLVFVDMLYRGKWVRFDLSAMEAQYLSAEDLVSRYLNKAFQALSLPRDNAGSSSSETPS